MSDKSLRLPESLYNVPPKFTLSEFRVYVFPVLASLASYHAHLEPYLQQNLIKCLEVREKEKYIFHRICNERERERERKREIIIRITIHENYFISLQNIFET